MVPDDRLLVETDAPYLAPAPHRGKRNEPSFLAETVRKLAEVRGAEPARIAEITTRNFERLCLAGRSGYTEESDEQR
jgi:TatD DNase family protein